MAWNNVLARNKIPFREITAEDVRRVTGKPHEVCIQETFASLPPETIRLISEETATEDNLVIEQLGGTLYEGVRDGLVALQQRFPLFIVSNCQRGYIEGFLAMHQLGSLFTDFECWGNTGRPKGDNLHDVLVRNDLKNSIMVGDADGDEKAARECQIPYAFVTYGFGRGIAPDHKFDQFSDLVNFLLSSS